MWKRLEAVFTLKSPLHIGYLPSRGSVISRTRYYVPGKNFWGAVTKRTTEELLNRPSARDYLEIGKQMKNAFLFTYFYLYDGKTEYTPKFTDNGLKYGDEQTIDVSKFERLFIGSRISTAIDRDSGTAKDESFHETEFINNKYPDNKDIKDTMLKGAIWIKEEASLSIKDGEKEIQINKHGIFVSEINLIEKLILGGEQNYGFGLVELESTKTNNSNDARIIVRKDAYLPSHLEYRKDIDFKGEIELLGGRGYFDVENEKQLNYSDFPGRILSKMYYYIAPGSSLSDTQELILQWNGIMKVP